MIRGRGGGGSDIAVPRPAGEDGVVVGLKMDFLDDGDRMDPSEYLRGGTPYLAVKLLVS